MKHIESSAQNCFTHLTSKKSKIDNRPIPNSKEQVYFSSEDNAETKNINIKNKANTVDEIIQKKFSNNARKQRF